MSTLRLEFFKCRRRKIFLVGLALIAAQLLWMSVTIMRGDAPTIIARDGSGCCIIWR